MRKDITPTKYETYCKATVIKRAYQWYRDGEIRPTEKKKGPRNKSMSA